MRSVLVLVCALAGCIESALVECADGRACPRGLVCDDVHVSCVSPDQITSCTGMPDFTACDAVAGGRCFDAVCLPGGCGNGFKEPEELCDDGNLDNDDGCAGNCASLEVCGDGVAERGRSEECDDGNARSRDGCTSRCTIELLSWHSAGIQPSGRGAPSSGYDPIRRRALVFGGVVNTGQTLTSFLTLGDTWEWGSGAWFDAGGVAAPAVRAGAAVGYDPIRRRFVMFGGLRLIGIVSTVFNDTWEWDGLRWEAKTSTYVPRARYGTATAWDPIRRGVVMFGGQGGNSVTSPRFDDTWLWDGERWLQIQSAQRPAARTRVRMTYDGSRQRVLLFGGEDADRVTLTDTWELDANGWTQRATTGAPADFEVDGLAYDARRNVVVATGYSTAAAATVTLELVGDTWQTVPSTTLPPRFLAMFFDVARERVIGLGGSTAAVKLIAWEWDGANWVNGAPPVPPARGNAAIAYDPLRARVVLYGGASASTPLPQTWEWDGEGWRDVSPATQPPGVVAAAMAFDPVSRRTLLFGGATDTGNTNETWSWDGSTWSLVETPTAPPARRDAALVATRTGLLLFGGNDSAPLGDTWRWNGTAWEPLTPASSPSARHGTAVTYDHVRDRVLLYGGNDGALRDDTWEWDGTTWTLVAPTAEPGPRAEHSLVYDEARRRVLLFGGDDLAPWEWDGAQWLLPAATSSRSDRRSVAATYDRARDEIVGVGGFTAAGNPLPELLTLAFRGAIEEVCRLGVDLDDDSLAGCDDPDCIGTCAPLCFEHSACGSGEPSCGDGACSSIETDLTCSAECPAPPPLCGDGYCSSGEVCSYDCQ